MKGYSDLYYSRAFNAKNNRDHEQNIIIFYSSLSDKVQGHHGVGLPQHN